MNLSDFLTESEISFAEAALAEKLARIGEEHEAALAQVNERYKLVYTMARRSVLADVLGVSLFNCVPMTEDLMEEAPLEGLVLGDAAGLGTTEGAGARIVGAELGTVGTESVPPVDASPVGDVLNQEDATFSADFSAEDAALFKDIRQQSPKVIEEAPKVIEEAPKVAQEPTPKVIGEAPKAALSQCYTALEIAAKLRVHKDTIAYYKRQGLLPDPLPGSGGKPGNPYLYEISNWKEFKTRVEARRNAAIGAPAKAQMKQLQDSKLKGSPSGSRYTSRELAQAMGAHQSSVSNWVKAGWITPLDMPEVRGFVFEVQDIEALKADFEARRVAAKLANGAHLQPSKAHPQSSKAHIPAPVETAATPTPEPLNPTTEPLNPTTEPLLPSTPKPKSIELPEPKSMEVSESSEGATDSTEGATDSTEGDAEPSEALVGLEKASRHPYHWSQALPIVQAAIERSDGEPFEVAYQRSEETFVVRPLGGVTADLDPFARVLCEMGPTDQPSERWDKPSGTWQIIPSLRTGWLAPQAQALRAAWQRQHAGSLAHPVSSLAHLEGSVAPQSSGSTTRSLQP